MPKYIENYALYEEIGSGVYGKVYRAINNKDQKEYAIKVIPITKFRENKKLEECTVNEINILTNIEVNKHIIRYFDMLKTTNNFYFIYEFCNGGTLDQVITKQGKLSQERALQIFSQLLEAFKILNKYNIMHRDLKPDNIFFHDGLIKLGDFGFCKNLESADQMARTMLGSPIYMAPEVIKGEVYSNKADIWSLGVVLYEMIFGHCPFMSNSIAKLIEVLSTQKLTFPSDISPFVANLLQRMLTKDPMQRIGWLQIFMLKINSDGRVSNNQKHITSLQDAQSSQQTNKAPSVSTIKGNSNASTESNSQPGSSNNIFVKQPNSGGFKKKTNGNLNGNGNGNGNGTGNVNGNGKGNEFYGTESKHDSVSADHKKSIEGVKLALDLVSSKMNNCMGFGNLVLIETIRNLNEQHDKCKNNEIKSIIASQVRQLKKEQQNLSKKMFSYELKGIEDWKKYLRGKFFEQQSTIQLWYRMVCLLDNRPLNNSGSLTNKQMSESIKSSLY